MRVLFVTDIHGNRKAYRELFDEALRQRCEAIVLGGDLLPQKGFIRDAISGQREFLEGFLEPMVRQFRAAHPSIDVYWIFGNDDWAVGLDPILRLHDERIAFHLHDGILDLGPYQITGYSFVPLSPFGIKDWEKFDTPDQPVPVHWTPPVMSGPDGRRPVQIETDVRSRGTIQEDLGRLATRCDPSRTIFVTHTPPFDTWLDRLSTGQHAGSRALRRFIEQHQPPVTLHGHIHESPQMSGRFWQGLGQTVMINPGASASALRALVFDVSHPVETFQCVGAGWADDRNLARR